MKMIWTLVDQNTIKQTFDLQNDGAHRKMFDQNQEQWVRGSSIVIFWIKNRRFVINISSSHTIFIFGTCYGRYCVTQSVSPKVPENPSGPLIDNFIVLPCVACGVACVKLLPGVDRWNSLDDLRVIGPCHCEVWGWPRHQADFDWFFGRPILETSRRGASFRVTHTANRKC